MKIITQQMVDNRAKQIGDKPAFCAGGMTYRHWLIGQVISGCADCDLGYMSIAEYARKYAEEVLQDLAQKELEQ